MRSHVSVFVLEVCFSVITDDPVCVGSGVGLLLSARYMATQVVVQALEETFAQVHVADGVNAFWELNRTWQLTISVAPVMLNALQVPLVY